MAKFIPIILPQPGEDLRTWARQLTSQLQSLTAQLSSVLANIEATGGGGGTPTPGGTTTPVKTPDDVTILDVNGYYIDGLGRVIVDANGLHVYDLVGFQVINGPNVYINTEHLVENAVKTAQLANDAVTYEKFFPDLVPIKIVDTLPNPVGYTGPGVVWLSTDRKLYRHTGTAWTSAVPAVDITGQLTNAQLESIAAAKLTGQIVETQIADDSISTPKLAAGSVSTAKLAAGAVVADTIAAEAVTATKLAAGSVEADKIAANAVTTSKLDALAVTAGKLAAGSVVAGKLAANAIVANDGVIGTAAIADAQIIDLNANKITAGSIAAERMEANIVTALNGKFATLSALASSLGVVQILSGGALFTQGVTAYASGTGVWMGQDGGVYKWRAGNPAGARIQWTGSALEVYNSSNQLTIASGNVDWAGVINKTGFAAISQITSSNVTTYIDGAAIGNAQIDRATVNKLVVGTADIASAAITNAKIGNAAIDTLQVAGNAISAPQSQTVAETSTSQASVSSRTTNYTLGTFTTSAHGRGQVLVFLSPNTNVGGGAIAEAKVGDGNAAAYSYTARASIYRGGTRIYTEYVSGTYDKSALLYVSAFIDSPGAGTVSTYSIRLETTSSASNASIKHSHSLPELNVTFFEFKR